MLSKLFRDRIYKIYNGEDVDLEFSYSKIPLSLELYKRQQEEILLKEHGVIKKKKSEILSKLR